MKTKGSLIAIITALAVPCAVAQQMSSDQQIVVPKPAKKMTPEEAAADKAAKRDPKKTYAPTKGPNAEVDKGQQVKTMTPPKAMTPEEKAADKKAKRVPPTPEEQAKQAKQSPG